MHKGTNHNLQPETCHLHIAGTTEAPKIDPFGISQWMEATLEYSF